MEDLMHSNYLFPPPSFSNHPRPSPADENAVKSRIMAHPYYPSLVAAYADCHKLGAPPEVAARLSAFSHDLQIRPSCANFSTADTELDLFMEAYCNILVKYRAEIATPLEEAAEFLRRAESQLSSITASRSVSSFRLSADHEKCGAACSANCEDRSDAGAFKEAVLGYEMRAEDREMKRHLLRKYGGYFGSLWQELSKKKKKGKLSNEARQKLLSWWELHKKWPYPSESEKMTLTESTGLDQKQINNWFINQRKRHWKPSEEMQVQMQFLIFNDYQEQQQQQQQNAMSFYMEGNFMGDDIYP